MRVSALEKKSDNVRITGAIRYHWARKGGNVYPGGSPDKVEHGLRSRLYFNGKVNDNWTYVGRIQNQQFFRDDVGNELTQFNVAKLEGRLGGVKVIAGRDDDVFADGYIFDGCYDALKLSYGDKWYFSGAYGKLTDWNEDALTNSNTKRFWAAEIGSNIEDAFVNGKVGYLNAKLGADGQGDYDKNNIGIWYVGAGFNLAKDLVLDAMYLRSNSDKFTDGVGGYNKTKKDGLVIGLGYRGADESEPGSWGLSAKFYNQGKGTYLMHTIDGYTDFNSGFKGWSFGGDVTLAKNMVFSATYYDTKAKDSAMDAGADHAKVLWTELNLSF